MLECGSCRRTDALTVFCENCGRAYCCTHAGASCLFCGKQSKIQQLVLREELVDEIRLQWVLLPENKSVGIVNFAEIPRFLFGLARGGLPAAVDIILFQDRVALNRFVESVRNKPLPRSAGIVTQQSRYSFMLDPNTGRRYLLLNHAAFRGISNFGISFFSNWMRQLDLVLRQSKECEKMLFEAVMKCYSSYNAKFGIPFVTTDDHTQEFIVELINNLKGGYSQSLAFLHSIRPGNMDEAERFISHKLDLIFPRFKKSGLRAIESIVDLIALFVQILLVLEAAKVSGPVHASLESKFDIWKRSLLEEFRDTPDLLSALNKVEKHFKASVAIRSIEKFSGIFSESLTLSFCEIAPRYGRLQEVVELAEAAFSYCENIEKGLPANQLRFGDVDAFLVLLETIFAKDGVYPQTPILAGHAILDVLQSQILQGNEHAYRRALPHVYRLSKLVESGIPIIRRVNPRVPIGFEYGIEPLLAFSQIAWMFGDETERSRLREQAVRLARRHNTQSVIIGLHWMDFLATHDYSHLKEIHRCASGPDELKREDIWKFPHWRVVWLVSAAVFERENAIEYLDLAEKAAAEIVLPPARYFVGSQAILASEALMLTVDLFRKLLSLEEKFEVSLLDQARICALTLSQTRPPNAPEQLLAQKTFVIHSLISSESESLHSAMEALRKLGKNSREVTGFVSAVERYMNTRDAGERISLVTESGLNELDPWSALARDFFRRQIPELVLQLKPENRVVLVEGPTDVRVFDAFRQKIRLANMRFVSMAGCTNAPYFAAVSTLLGSVFKDPISIFVIFDGDVEPQRFQSLKDKFSTIRTIQLARLSRKTIEDYLLSPDAIKAAFPEIPLALDEMESAIRRCSDRMSKKAVIESILSKGMARVTYNPEVAGKIAEAIALERMDPEIVDLLKKIDLSFRSSQI